MPLRRAGIPSLYFGLCSESIDLVVLRKTAKNFFSKLGLFLIDITLY
ncbi:hypothetical protein T4C_13010 [Trichinella pseudospiralis]|uniref:Uncharacterized protein n=1 Tax=Trichinella pseudospiralis TaxID=6337 RepID=A0A0V1GHF5_TRIPS|nr:hypothetical protein T4C_13010 [Trichinella pseudospiralis]